MPFTVKQIQKTGQTRAAKKIIFLLETVEKERIEKDPILFGAFQNEKERSLLGRCGIYIKPWHKKVYALCPTCAAHLSEKNIKIITV